MQIGKIYARALIRMKPHRIMQIWKYAHMQNKALIRRQPHNPQPRMANSSRLLRSVTMIWICLLEQFLVRVCSSQVGILANFEGKILGKWGHEQKIRTKQQNN